MEDSAPEGAVLGSKYMKNKTKQMNWDLLPIILMTAVLPLIALGQRVTVSIGKCAWFPDGEYQYDFFMHAKSTVFLVLVVWMLIVLADRVLIRRIQIRNWKYFIPLYLYLLLAVFSTILSVDKTLSLKGMWQQYESIWVLTGYVITVFFCTQVIEKLSDLKVICGAVAVGAFLQGMIGLSQLLGKDFFSNGIGKKLMNAGIDSAAENTLQYQFSGAESSVYMASYNPNYAAVYIILILPLILALFFAVKKQISKILCVILSMLLLLCLYGSGSETGLLVGGMLIVITVIFKELMRKTTVAKRGLGILLCLVIVCGEIGGYDMAKDHVLLNAIKKSVQKQTYNLEAIEADGEGVTLCYCGKEFKLIPKNTEVGQSLTAVEDGKTSMTASWDSDTQSFRFKDTVYDNWHYDTYEQDGVQYLLIQGKKLTWIFYKETGSDKYIYLNQNEKADEIKNANAVFKGYERTLSGRGYIWGRTIPLLTGHLLWGSGPDTFAVVFPQTDYLMKANTSFRMYQELTTKAHNMYLQTALQTGVLSLICLMAFWIRYFILFLKNIRKGERKELLWLRCGVAVGILGFLLMGMLNDSNLAVSPVFWCVLGMGIAMEQKTFHS